MGQFWFNFLWLNKNILKYYFIHSLAVIKIVIAIHVLTNKYLKEENNSKKNN